MMRSTVMFALLATVTIGCVPKTLERVLPLPLRPDSLELLLPPDLVVTVFETTGPAVLNTQGAAQLPVRVVVRNQGGMAAPVFKVSTDYVSGLGAFVVAFTVPGEADLWYPHTDAPLPGGGEATFEGVLAFHPSVHGEVSLTAYADSCSGDEFVAAECRVFESNETNNESAAIVVVLP